MPVVAKYSIITVSCLLNCLVTCYSRIQRSNPSCRMLVKTPIVIGRDARYLGVVWAKPPHKPGGSKALTNIFVLSSQKQNLWTLILGSCWVWVCLGLWIPKVAATQIAKQGNNPLFLGRHPDFAEERISHRSTSEPQEGQEILEIWGKKLWLAGACWNWMKNWWSGEDPCSFLAILFILLFKYLNSEGYRGKLTQMQGLQCSDRNSTWLVRPFHLCQRLRIEDSGFTALWCRYKLKILVCKHLRMVALSIWKRPCLK